MNVCLFCGSASGANPVYAEAARDLARMLVEVNATLIYGGGNIGLMGVTADEMMKRGGEVIGVIPDFLLQKEVGHKGITRLEVVSSMHERKRRMADLADAFIAMPGGWGTLDELAEILTWKQLQLVHSPVGVLNTAGFFDFLIRQMEMMVQEGFLRYHNFAEIKISDNPSELLLLLGVITGNSRKKS
jgi:uncharacterized protein (TIGR00730 family)